MSSFDSRLLCDVIEHPIAGKRPIGGVDADSDGIPSLGGENILKEGGVNCDSVKRIPPAFYRLMPRGHLRAMDVLINKDGAQTGKLGLYQGQFTEAAINEHLFILRGKDSEIEQQFLYYALLSPAAQAKISRFISGSAQPGLNTKFVRKVDIPVPPLHEQRRIVKVLSTVDNLIEKTEALIAKQEAAGQGLLSELIRSPYSGGGSSQRFFAPLGSAVELNAHSVASPYVQFRYLDISTVGSGVYNEEPARVERNSAPSRARRVVTPGDTIVSTVRPNLRAMMYIERVDEPTLASTGFAVLSPRPNVAPKYVYYLVADQRFTNYLVSRSKGATYPAVGQDDISEGMVYLPDLEQQRKISSVLDASNEFILKSRLELSKFKDLKQGLMNDLLSGVVSTERHKV